MSTSSSGPSFGMPNPETLADVEMVDLTTFEYPPSLFEKLHSNLKPTQAAPFYRSLVPTTEILKSERTSGELDDVLAASIPAYLDQSPTRAKQAMVPTLNPGHILTSNGESVLASLPEAPILSPESGHVSQPTFLISRPEIVDLTTESPLELAPPQAVPKTDAVSNAILEGPSSNPNSPAFGLSAQSSFPKSEVHIVDLTIDNDPEEAPIPPTLEGNEATTEISRDADWSPEHFSYSPKSAHTVRPMDAMIQPDLLDSSNDIWPQNDSQRAILELKETEENTLDTSDWMEISSTSSLGSEYTIQHSFQTTKSPLVNNEALGMNSGSGPKTPTSQNMQKKNALARKETQKKSVLVRIEPPMKNVVARNGTRKNRSLSVSRPIVIPPPIVQEKKVMGSKIVKEKSLRRGRSPSPLARMPSKLKIVDRKAVTERPRSVSPHSRVDPGNGRVTKVIVKSQILKTGSQLNLAEVYVLNDLRVLRLRKIGEKKWVYARKGADWDNLDEKLSLDFVKLMGWAVESEEWEVCTLDPQSRFKKLREVGDVEALSREVRWSKPVKARTGRLETGRLELGIFPVGWPH